MKLLHAVFEKWGTVACCYVARVVQYGGLEVNEDDYSVEGVKKRMSDGDWNKILAMSQDHNLYDNLCSSLFPTIHGESLSSYYSMIDLSKYKTCS